ncbi:hypothetical protein CLV46_1708 [Diaminobutyricimonas aerilata]|uniref:Uncharacterized protein n=1 Tax=Diaminobutyricimonas aerilata TaxID=1162967 RepID=A0A2M9CJR4_9MICO|nr:hypothetical protein [Diaminobutyricimonas aerilata]PJJ72144.1 hypothetical protein CLV46_1708 [Diaminobutyricimonas aerilata]
MTALRRRSPARDDRILPFTRVLAAVILPFLLVAAVLLCLFSESTDELFAWTIAPPFTAMLLGCAYIGGIWFFVAVLRGSRWHGVWTGMPAVLVFATMAAVATFLHFDRFHHGHISFLAWLALYATTPVLVTIAIVLNGPRDPRASESGDVEVPRVVRYGFGAVGLLSVAVGLALFLAPEMAIPVWAWPLTPLTARIVGAVLILPGMVDVLLLRDGRWSSFRTIFGAQLVSIAAISVCLLARGGDLYWDRVAAPAFVAALAAAAIAYATLMIAMTRRRNRAEVSPAVRSR